MRHPLTITIACLLPVLVGCGQKGGLYLPDAAPAAVHKPATAVSAAPETAAPAPETTAPPPPSTPAPVAEPNTSPDVIPPGTPPADDPTTRRKIPTTPDPSTSQ